MSRLLAFAALWTAVALSGCASANGKPTAADVTLFEAEQQACVAQATSLDAGAACLAAVRATRCGPGGIWIEAGVCPAQDGGAP